MGDVAAAAGVARATVYRYFPNRQALLDQLADWRSPVAGERLAAARLDEVPVHQGVERAVRALVDIGDYFVVLARERVDPNSERVRAQLSRAAPRAVRTGSDGGIDPGRRPVRPGSTESLVALVVERAARTAAARRRRT